MAAKPASAAGVTGASVPPQNITSARPSRIASRASPIAMFEAAQAVLCASNGPRVPSSIETQPAGRFGSVCTIENGLTRSGAAVRQLEHRLLERSNTTERRPDRRPGALAHGGDIELRVLLRLARSGDDEVRTAVHAPRRLLVDEVGGVEVVHFAREPHRETVGVELGDRPGAGLPRDQRRPRRRSRIADRAHDPEPRDHDSSAKRFHRPRLLAERGLARLGEPLSARGCRYLASAKSRNCVNWLAAKLLSLTSTTD